MGSRCGCLSRTESDSPNLNLEPALVPVNRQAIDLSHFKMLGIIGKGGFAEVYLATHRITQDKVALKRIQKREVLVIRNSSRTRSRHGKMSPSTVSSEGSFGKNNRDWSLRAVVFTERNAMIGLRSPFLMPLFNAFQDPTALYLCMPFMPGGDMGYFIRKTKLLSEREARFYAAEMVLALEELHMLHHIVYRDLKPSNLLMSKSGHICLTDFGLCAQLRAEKDWRTSGNVGTMGYQAPEVVQRRPYSFGVDFFSLGVTIYRIVTGKRPYGKQGAFRVPIDLSYFSSDLADLLGQLLELDPEKRLGSGDVTANHSHSNDKNDLRPQSYSRASSLSLNSHSRRSGPSPLVFWNEVKSHKFFADIDWKAMSQKQIEPPLKPRTNNRDDRNKLHANFPNSHSLRRESKGSKNNSSKNKYPPLPLTQEQQNLFNGFEYNVALPRANPDGKDQRSVGDVVPLSTFKLQPGDQMFSPSHGGKRS